MEKLNNDSEDFESIDEVAAGWVIRRADAPDDVELESAFQTWLSGDSRRFEAYRSAEDLFAGASEPRTHSDAALKRVSQRMRARKSYWSRPAIAAAAAIFVLVGITFWMLDPEGTKLMTDIAEQRELTLSDETLVELDAQTQLRFHFTEESRKVYLQAGAAVFDIAVDSRPFEVRVGDYVIRDIGTIFSVKINDSMLNASEESFAVSVEEGEVEVSRVQEGRIEPVSIVRGQEAEFVESIPVTVQPIMDDSFASWREKRFHYRDRSLDQVFADLQRFHKRRIVLADTSLAKEELSGMLDVSDLDEALNVLSKALPILYEVEGDGEIVVSRAR
ncbi:FecR domain-containing protein [Puniceicoccaceae bacterium K14]|nr:FecR domain-containing protein [Puniceicoccaceae bacterium K14]